MIDRYDFVSDGLSESTSAKLDLMRVETDAVMQTAELIFNAMQGAGWNQKQLAASLEVTPGYVSRLLSGAENITVKQISRVLFKLGRHYIQESCPIGTDYFRHIKFGSQYKLEKRELTQEGQIENNGWAILRFDKDNIIKDQSNSNSPDWIGKAV